MPTAFVYVRVSTGPQEVGKSLDVQVQECVALAESKGYEVPETGIYREVWSGSDLHRPVLDVMLEDVERGKAEAVCIYNPVRLGREPLYNSMIYARLRGAGAKVLFVDGSMEDTPEGRLVLYVQGYAGQQERNQFVTRAMATKKAAAKAGRMPVGTGVGLFGYDFDRETKKRVINELEAYVVRLGFGMRIARTNDYQIAVKLNEMGFRTKQGKLWQHRTVGRMLANESYAGVDYYGRYRWRRLEDKKVEVTPQPAEEVVRIEGYTPPIISRAVFERAQELREEPRAVVRAEKKEYVLTGFSRCLTCGGRVSGACLSGKFRYYRCRMTGPTAARPATCSELYIPADEYEEEVWTLFCHVVRDPAVLVADVRSRRENGVGNTAEEKAKLRREVGRLGREQARLLSLRLKDEENLIDDEIFFGQLAPVKALYDEKQRAIAKLEEQERNNDDAALVESRIVEMCRVASSKLDHLDFQGKRALMTAFGVKVHVIRDDFRLEVEVSPEVTTIGQTWGCLSSSKYSFVIVELEEVVVQKRPRVVEFVPVDRGGDL